MEWHGAIAIYVIGTLALIISAVHTAVTSQEKRNLNEWLRTGKKSG